MVSSSQLPPSSSEPSSLRQLSTAQQDRLTSILDEYMVALEDGTPLSVDHLCGEHPDLAETIREFCHSLDELHGIATAQRSSNSADTAAEYKASRQDDERQLGDFRLVREIGHGGMGVVYEAHQLSLDRRVAIKVLPFASVLDPKQLARFKNEAQAAALVQHPNIVPVYSVGSERGVHYYAMQFIAGVSLDRVIETLRSGKFARRRMLETSPNSASPTTTVAKSAVDNVIVEFDTADSTSPAGMTSSEVEALVRSCRELNTVLHIGIQAAEALHSAHEQGIVHRDIKPSNLLLDETRKLWVTDFGLARVQKDAALTHTGDVVGTRRYMSPEQATGRNTLVDHRTDIYALGLTLFELLTLRPAIEDESTPSTSSSSTSPILSHRQRRIPFDLETILLRATAENRDDRYANAQELADDLRRVVAGVPVLARRLSWRQRLGNWCRRHQRIVTATGLGAAVALVVLTSSFLYVARQRQQTEAHLQLANRRFQEARQMVDRLSAELAAASDPSEREAVRLRLLNESLGYYLQFADELGSSPELAMDAVDAQLRAAQLASDLGAIHKSIELYESACAFIQRLSHESPQDYELQRKLGPSLNNLGMELIRAGRLKEAQRVLRRCMNEQERFVKTLAAQNHDIADLGQFRTNLGLALANLNELEEAASTFRSAVHVLEPLTKSFPDNADYAQRLASAHNNLGNVYTTTDPLEAIRYFQISVGILEPASQHNDSNSDRLAPSLVSANESNKVLEACAKGLNNLAALYSRLNRSNDSVAAYQKAISIHESLRDRAPTNLRHQSDLAVTLNNCGVAQTRQKAWKDAEQTIQRAIDLLTPLTQSRPDDAHIRSSLGGAYNNLGSLYEAREELKSAAAAFRSAIEQQNLATQLAPEITKYREFRGTHFFNASRVLRELNEPAQALELVRKFVSLSGNSTDFLISAAAECIKISQMPGVREANEPFLASCHNLAVESLESAVAKGWQDVNLLLEDQAFIDLHHHPKFKALVSGMTAADATAAVESTGQQPSSERTTK